MERIKTKIFFFCIGVPLFIGIVFLVYFLLNNKARDIEPVVNDQVDTETAIVDLEAEANREAQEKQKIEREFAGSVELEVTPLHTDERQAIEDQFSSPATEISDGDNQHIEDNFKN